MGFTLDSQNKTVSFKNTDPYVGVKKVINFVENRVGTASFIREWRYSYDNQTFSSWSLFTQENITSVEFDSSKKLWIEMRYDWISGNAMLSDVGLMFEYGNDVPEECHYCYLEGENQNQIIDLDCFNFNPYDFGCAAGIQSELSQAVNMIFGHSVFYFRRVPQERSKDIFFMEWTLYNVDEKSKQCIKVIVPDNEFPDNKISYGNFGMDFEFFEIHIDKMIFERAYGGGKRPQKGDIIVFTQMGRIYQIASMSFERDVMLKELYYKVALTKYEPKSNTNIEDSVQEQLDEITLNTEELFGEMKHLETLQNVNDTEQQFSENDYRLDHVRKKLAFELDIREEKINNFYNYLAEYNYNLSSMYKESVETSVISYKEDDWKAGEDRMFSSWFRIEKSVSKLRKVNSVSHVSGNRYMMNTLAVVQWKAGERVEIYSSLAGLKLWGTVVNTISTSPTLTIDQPMLDYANSIDPSWMTLSDLQIRKTSNKVFLDSWSQDKGYKIEMISDNSVLVYLNEKRYYFNFPSLTIGKWYGMVINMSNSFKQLSLDIWKMQWDSALPTVNRSSVLLNVFNNIYTIESVDRISDEDVQIFASEMSLTNIRLMNKTIEREKQSKFLNQMIVRDSQWQIIMDNARPIKELPYIGETK